MSLVNNTLHFVHKYLHFLICLLVFCLVITTFGNLQVFISKQSLCDWDEDKSVLFRFIEDAVYLLIFVALHSLMATVWFKDILKWFNITVSERLVYVVCSCLSLMLMIIMWQGIPETYLWFIDTTDRFFLRTFFYLLHIVCWILLGLEILSMEVGEMLGITQVYRYHSSSVVPSKARLLVEIYSRMRHPGSLLLPVLLWLHPLMTLDRLLLACSWTSYIIGRHSFDEKHYEFAEKHFTLTYTVRKEKEEHKRILRKRND